MKIKLTAPQYFELLTVVNINYMAENRLLPELDHTLLKAISIVLTNTELENDKYLVDLGDRIFADGLMNMVLNFRLFLDEQTKVMPVHVRKEAIEHHERVVGVLNAFRSVL